MSNRNRLGLVLRLKLGTAGGVFYSYSDRKAVNIPIGLGPFHTSMFAGNNFCSVRWLQWFHILVKAHILGLCTSV